MGWQRWCPPALASLTACLGWMAIFVPVLVVGDVVLVQWGRQDCEGRGAELVYSGLMAGPSRTGSLLRSYHKN